MAHSNNMEGINIFTFIALVYHVHIVAIHCVLVLVRRIVPVRFLFDPDALSLTIMVTVSITVPLSIALTIAISVPVTISVTPSLSFPEEDRTMSHNRYNNRDQSKRLSQFNTAICLTINYAKFFPSFFIKQRDEIVEMRFFFIAA